MTRIRRSVWALAPGDSTLDWYRQAVAAMVARPVTDPASWRYQAAIHGVPFGTAIPPAASGIWDECQHQTWYFLPWHRAYLAAFESIVAQTVEELGGPADWELPYWDYSENLAVNPNARLLHPAFRDRLLANGSPNHLWSQRKPATGGNYGLTTADVSLAALTLTRFVSGSPAPPGFGGPKTGWNHGGGTNGALESVPHNIVHVRIGGSSGFMSDPATAALDPIFWLHHCNIDRLWEVWRNQGPTFQQPTDPAWRSGLSYRFVDGAGAPYVAVTDDLLDTRTVLHGYRYDSVPVATEPAVAAIVGAGMDEPESVELIGASATGTAIVGGGVRIDVPIDVRADAAAVSLTRRLYLVLENVTGAGRPGNYDVMVGVEGREDIAVGILSTFGIERASRTDSRHGGSGVTQSFDVTEAAARLGVTESDADRLSVHIVRIEEDAAVADLDAESGVMPAGLEDVHLLPPGEPSITIGRVGLYRG
jgi:tyrosinase